MYGKIHSKHEQERPGMDIMERLTTAGLDTLLRNIAPKRCHVPPLQIGPYLSFRRNCILGNNRYSSYSNNQKKRKKEEQFMGTHYIVDDCTMCGACEPVCPVDAISADEPNFVIDQDTCIDCGACDDVCPVDAIKWEETNA